LENFEIFETNYKNKVDENLEEEFDIDDFREMIGNNDDIDIKFDFKNGRCYYIQELYGYEQLTDFLIGNTLEYDDITDFIKNMDKNNDSFTTYRNYEVLAKFMMEHVTEK